MAATSRSNMAARRSRAACPERHRPVEGREWRTGADEATTLKTDKPLKIGNLAVPAGTYTLYTIPTQRRTVDT